MNRKSRGLLMFLLFSLTLIFVGSVMSETQATVNDLAKIGIAIQVIGYLFIGSMVLYLVILGRKNTKTTQQP